MTGSQHRPAPG